MADVQFTFNGDPIEVQVEDDELLLDTIRDRLETTSVRYSCGIGVCGTCTVLLDHEAVSSCLQLTCMVADKDVRTSEGVLDPLDGNTHRVLDEFVTARAFQCSYCIPAMALTVASLLDSTADLTRERLREELGGNICRCGSYPQILEAIWALIGPSQEDT